MVILYTCQGELEMSKAVTFNQRRCTKCQVIEAHNFNTDSMNPVCAAGHRMKILVIEGRIGTGKCDSRCTDSIRDKCRCVCGGANHATTFGVFESGR